ncbi:MAG: argininosuccinate lyase [Pseudomonadota bacterium]
MAKESSNKMWGGRFDTAPSDIMTQINASIDIDKRLYKHDITASKAHANMLSAQNIISVDDNKEIQNGLNQVLQEIENGDFQFSAALEDIHMNVENRLKEIIGDTAGKLHTARSRNDQVATDFKLWVREACDILMDEIEEFQNTLQNIANKNNEVIMPGFTHLQVAQPVLFSSHMTAYHAMLERDKSRLQDCRKRHNTSPLGAAAMAGTGFPIDRKSTAKALGFDRVADNTMDAVGSRDFAIEFLYVTAQCGLHLSRLAEEIIIWSTPQFGFITLSDEWSTGSSIMPQKKNPDAAELVRGKIGRLNGNLLQLMTVLKALPLTYNKDLQEDKAAVFESFDTLILCLKSCNGMIGTMSIHEDNMLTSAQSGYSNATELADWLVRTLDIPFRDAHHITGRIVKLAEKQNCRLEQLSLADMQAIEPCITDEIHSVLDIKNIVQSRT